MLKAIELAELGVSEPIRTALTRLDPNNGFKTGLYRDGVTGKFILAFAQQTKKSNLQAACAVTLSRIRGNSFETIFLLQ